MQNTELEDTLKAEYDKLEDEVKYILDIWIGSLQKADEYNYNHTSYSLKHCFETHYKSLGRYYTITSNHIKYAMLKNGFIPDEETDDEWCFKLSEVQNFNWNI
jgi:hypothetical protein